MLIEANRVLQLVCTIPFKYKKTHEFYDEWMRERMRFGFHDTLTATYSAMATLCLTDNGQAYVLTHSWLSDEHQKWNSSMREDIDKAFEKYVHDNAFQIAAELRTQLPRDFS